MRSLLPVAALLLLVAQPVAGRPAPRATQAAYAVIVHPTTTTAAITLPQLRRLFLGEDATWPGGGRVVLFIPAPETGGAVRATVLRRLYQMDETAFKRYWIDRTFRDEAASGPKLVGSPAVARRLTATIPGAVAVIPATDVDGSVKVLRIDGRLPGDAGYPLVP